MASDEHTVFVFGAGASLAEAVARRPKRRAEHPPLDSTFFRRVAEHRRSPLFNRVEAQARRLGFANLVAETPPTRLETYLGRLFFEINHNPLSASVRAYFEALELYAREVTMTTNWMMQKAGLIRKVIQAELRAGCRVSVITFNIDLLLENTLNRLSNSRPAAAWSLDSAYGFSNSPPMLHGTSSAFGDPFPVNRSPSEILLYKMHGSLNWVFKHRDPYPPADLVTKDRQMYLLNHQELPDSRVTVTTRTGGRPWYSFPLIVPPVYEKHAFIRRHLQEVWDGATQALDTATRVVFWGYSFPLADAHARHFFQARAQTNNALHRPVVINPDPQLAPTVWEVLRPRQIEQFRSAEEYLAD